MDAQEFERQAKQRRKHFFLWWFGWPIAGSVVAMGYESMVKSEAPNWLIVGLFGVWSVAWVLLARPQKAVRCATALRTLAIAAYLVSLALPPFGTLVPEMQELGVSILLFGWGALLLGPDRLYAWLANPLVIFCFIRMKKNPALCITAALLAIVAAHDFNQVATLGWDSSRDMAKGTVTGIKVGCYIWLASLATTLVASIAHLVNSRRACTPGSSTEGINAL